MAPRKTTTERDQQWAEDERRVWETFRPKLDALQTLVDAQLLVREAPPPNSPGRGYFSNLGFFLRTFAVPAASNHAEQTLYLQLIQRIDATGVLKPGARQKAEQELRRAIEAPEI